VWDWDRFTDDDFMGYFTIPVNDLDDGTEIESWFRLLPKPGIALDIIELSLFFSSFFFSHMLEKILLIIH